MKKAEKLVFEVPMTKEKQKELEAEKRAFKKNGRIVEFRFMAS